MAAVFVCRGCKGRATFVERFHRESDVEVKFVRCQKICHGPVVGAPVDGRIEWFERMSKPKRVKALAKIVNLGKRRVPDRLRKSRISKRSGTPAR